MQQQGAEITTFKMQIRNATFDTYAAYTADLPRVVQDVSDLTHVKGKCEQLSTLTKPRFLFDCMLCHGIRH